jgi:hypothetical protein
VRRLFFLESVPASLFLLVEILLIQNFSKSLSHQSRQTFKSVIAVLPTTNESLAPSLILLPTE